VTPPQQAIACQLCHVTRSRSLVEDAALTQEMALSARGMDSYALLELVPFAERTLGVSIQEFPLNPENLAFATSLAHYVADLCESAPRPVMRWAQRIMGWRDIRLQWRHICGYGLHFR